MYYTIRDLCVKITEIHPRTCVLPSNVWFGPQIDMNFQNNVLESVYCTIVHIQWNFIITRTFGPWKLPSNCYIRVKKNSNKYKELGPAKLPCYNFIITRTVGPWKLPSNCYIRVKKNSNKYKELGPAKLPCYNFIITRTFGPWKLPSNCYVRFLVISG